MAKLLLTLVGILMLQKTVSSAFTCNPTLDCKNNVIGAFVPDPNDCERYYGCLRAPDGSIVPSTSSDSCQYGYYFNQTTIACIVEMPQGVCNNLCQPGVCSSVCPAPYVETTYVADKLSCNKFYQCAVVGELPMTCPGTKPYFNGQMCGSDQSKCCNFCSPYCSVGGIQIQDPLDCTSYYFCYGVGQPSQSKRASCPAGSYFNEVSVQCVQGTCTNLCT